MKRIIANIVPAALAVLLCALALAGCGQGAAAANEVSMTATDFAPSAVTIKVGEAVHFTDPIATGGMHVICLGKDGSCDKSAQGPQALRGEGFTINAGSAANDVTFDTAGSYKITCSIHPNMNLTVTVQ